MSGLSKTQRLALSKLAEAGGEGVIDKIGRVVAAGEVLASQGIQPQPFASITWLRLVTTGHVESAGPGRLRLTDAGKKEAA